MIRNFVRISTLIAVIALLMFGFVVLHLVISADSESVRFFIWTVNSNTILTISYVLVGLAWVLQFLFTITALKRKRRTSEVLSIGIGLILLIVSIIILQIIVYFDTEYYFILGLTIERLALFDSAIIVIFVSWVLVFIPGINKVMR